MAPATAKPQILTIDDLEEYAALHLPKMVRDYYNGGSMDAYTLASSLEAYRRCQSIRPAISFPCCVAPAAMQKMAHPDGEEATARAAGSKGVLMGLSSFATTSLEVVKSECDKASRSRTSECVLQMYLFENREVSDNLIRRSEKAGYRAIVLTVDTPYFGRRLSEMRNGFKVPPHLKMANFDDSLGVKTGSQLRTEDRQSTMAQVKAEQRPLNLDQQIAASTDPKKVPPPNENDPSLKWDVVRYLKSITSMKIFLKGILTADDALLAVQNGADGIIVSNHGGRQLDCAPPTLEVLPEIVEAVQGRTPVHFDGGIRRGSDIFKALCLGADMCWVGRPVLCGLAYDGEIGVKLALDILEEEFRACMALTGMRSIDEIRKEGRKMSRKVSWGSSHRRLGSSSERPNLASKL